MEPQQSIQLVPIQAAGEILTISSVVFAEGLGIQHKNLLETIRTHKDAIEEGFGRVAFETRPFETGGGNQRAVMVYLTEDQALFVGTLSRNSERVVKFKTTLVKSFAAARKQLAGQAPTTPDYEKILFNQLKVMDDQQQQLRSLTQQVNQIKASLNPIQQADVQVPELKVTDSALRQGIVNHVDEYCSSRQYNLEETWHYLFKRLLVQNGIDVRKMYHAPGATHLDALEKHGLLDKLYAIVSLELK
ncbi:Rha family transcriptional regulator [Spirosoma arcticum]